MARMWEPIIVYEDRAKLTTSRWRLSGVRTRQGGENTDGGLLWLKTVRTGDSLAAELYKDEALSPAGLVANGTADVAGIDGSAEHAAELALTAANGSGLAGSFFVHAWVADAAHPVHAALCVDEDLAALWDGIEGLAGYDAQAGLAEFIRLADQDVLARVAAAFRDELGGRGSPDAWFLPDAPHSLPDLRRLANPAQLRRAAACRALQIALGRQHSRADDTAYSVLRDSFGREYENAMSTLRVAFREGSGATVARRLSRM